MSKYILLYFTYLFVPLFAIGQKANINIKTCRDSIVLLNKKNQKSWLNNKQLLERNKKLEEKLTRGDIVINGTPILDTISSLNKKIYENKISYNNQKKMNDSLSRVIVEATQKNKKEHTENSNFNYLLAYISLLIGFILGFFKESIYNKYKYLISVFNVKKHINKIKIAQSMDKIEEEKHNTDDENQVLDEKETEKSTNPVNVAQPMDLIEEGKHSTDDENLVLDEKETEKTINPVNVAQSMDIIEEKRHSSDDENLVLDEKETEKTINPVNVAQSMDTIEEEKHSTDNENPVLNEKETEKTINPVNVIQPTVNIEKKNLDSDKNIHINKKNKTNNLPSASSLSSNQIKLNINIEKIFGKGEDSDPICIGDEIEGVIAVFDGMGGAGATSYSIKGSMVSGAYLASRFTKKIVEKYFIKFLNKEVESISGNDIKVEIIKSLKSKFKLFNFRSSNIKSKLIKTFPTTAAILYYNCLSGSSIKLSLFWAGDSRCFCLYPDEGLQQLTRDDLVEYGDALQNLRSDSPISNCINIDFDFIINSHFLEIKKPVVIIAATDGAFGYFRTPMEFEYLLLSTLIKSEDMGNWQDILIKQLRSIAGDDVSLSLVALGFEKYEDFKQHYLNRNNFLHNKYIKIITETNFNDFNELELNSLVDNLWDQYKISYEYLIFNSTNNNEKR
jgi:hypothetical protein